MIAILFLVIRILELRATDSEAGESHLSLITLEIDRTCSEYSDTSIEVPGDMSLEKLASCKSITLPVKITNSDTITTLSSLQELIVCHHSGNRPVLYA